VGCTVMRTHFNATKLVARVKSGNKRPRKHSPVNRREGLRRNLSRSVAKSKRLRTLLRSLTVVYAGSCSIHRVTVVLS